MDIIVNFKKVSLTHYLNLKLKPSKIDGIDLYPLYSQVVYESKGTRFKSFSSLRFIGETLFYGKEYESKISDGSFLNGKDEKQLKNTDEKILRILQNEILKYKQGFSLKGLGKRFTIYSLPVLSVVDNSISFSMTNYLGSIFTYNKFTKIFNNKRSYEESVQMAIKEKPGLVAGMPKHLQYYFIVSALLKSFEDSDKEEIRCFDWVLDSAKKKDFFSAISETIQQIDGEGLMIDSLKEDPADFFSVIDLCINEQIKSTME